MNSNLDLSQFPSFLNLTRELAGNNKYAIKSKFNTVMSSCPQELRILAVEGMLFKSIREEIDRDLLCLVGNYIIRDEYRQQRINILVHLPRHLTLDHNTAKCMTLTIAHLVLERNRQLYYQYKNEFAEQLLKFVDPRVIGYTGQLDRFSLEIMRYLERYVKPLWSPKGTYLSNAFYSVMAKRVSEDSIDYFMEHIMESENYSYHSMMTALTEAVDENILKLKPALRFMQEKHVTCKEKLLLGSVSKELQTTIEVQFVRYLLTNTQFYGIERFMKRVAFGAVCDNDTIEQIAKVHINDLLLTMDSTPKNEWLIFLTRQSTLTKYYDGFKNRALEKALHFFDNVSGMTETQQKVFFSVVALQSSPKANCKFTGNDKLFRHLFIRCMSLLPSTRRTDLTMEFNSLHSVLYCIHNLYAIDGDRLEMMYEIDATWLKKVCHTLDLLTVTSNNIAHKKKDFPEFSEKLRRAEKKYRIAMDVGKLLSYMLGVLQNVDLKLDHPFMNKSEVFADDDWTDTFTKRTYIPLTKDLIKRGYKIDFLHRKPANVVYEMYGEESDVIEEKTEEKTKETTEEESFEAFRILFNDDSTGSNNVNENVDRNREEEVATKLIGIWTRENASSSATKNKSCEETTTSAPIYTKSDNPRTFAYVEALGNAFFEKSDLLTHWVEPQTIKEINLIVREDFEEDNPLYWPSPSEIEAKGDAISIEINKPSTSTNLPTEAVGSQLNDETVNNVNQLMRFVTIRRDAYEERIAIAEEQSNNSSNSTPPSEPESEHEIEDSDNSDNDDDNEDDEDIFSEYTLPSSDDEDNDFDIDDDDDLEDDDESDDMDGASRSIDFRRAIRLASVRDFRVRFGRSLNFTYDRQRVVGMTEFSSIFAYPNPEVYQGGDITVLLGTNNVPLGYYESEGRKEEDYVLNETDD
ncbi:hypothetical protein CAEBREN_22019 [Caenorhabditis brenneri]|uniref:Uncharacterized protein n=1 Tax=Caenorhabditis brenneri TaxID=135651 RepID=G0M766_CAEBE|nr:hypothetical protein CAEBREN_22019 [Caenorhabditis brenneri]